MKSSSDNEKLCEACGTEFYPDIAKVGTKFCSSDCLYNATGKIAQFCGWCGDEFDNSYIKTVGCSELCDTLLRLA